MKELILVGLIVCVLACGKAGVSGIDGLNGADGLPGVAGASGASQSCSVVQNSLGALIVCPDGSTAVVLNGQNGSDGLSANKGGKKCH